MPFRVTPKYRVSFYRQPTLKFLLIVTKFPGDIVANHVLVLLNFRNSFVNPFRNWSTATGIVFYIRIFGGYGDYKQRNLFF